MIYLYTAHCRTEAPHLSKHWLQVVHLENAAKIFLRMKDRESAELTVVFRVYSLGIGYIMCASLAQHRVLWQPFDGRKHPAFLSNAAVKLKTNTDVHARSHTHPSMHIHKHIHTSAHKESVWEMHFYLNVVLVISFQSRNLKHGGSNDATVVSTDNCFMSGETIWQLVWLFLSVYTIGNSWTPSSQKFGKVNSSSHL